MKVKEEITPTDGSARSEIQDWRALRKLDAEVAERVMGWTRHPEAMHPTDNRTIEGVLYCPPGTPWDCSALNVVPHYSSSIAAAMEVLERYDLWTVSKSDHPSAKEAPYTVTIFVLPRRHVSVHKQFKAEAARLPEAICHAALATVSSPDTVSETVASLS